MRIMGLSELLTGFAVTSVMALLAAPLYAAGAPSKDDAPPPPALVPEAPVRTIDVPDAELADRPPAEAPPADFTAAQYIDSAGCVFVRTPQGWRARVARDGTLICGYPATFSARHGGGDELALSQPEEPRAQRIERVLTETIVQNLQAGELVTASSDKVAAQQVAPVVPSQVAPPPAPAQAQPVSAADPLGLAAAVEAGRNIPAASPSARTQRLCELLGAEATSRPGAGGSSALGFCGTTVASVQPTVAAVPTDPAVPSNADAAAAEVVPKKTESATKTASVEPKRPETSANVDRKAVQPVAEKRTEKAASPKDKRPETKKTAEQSAKPAAQELMIPPGARFVQIGAYRDPANAERVAKRLVGMGFPIVDASQSGKHSIMVGPLDGREAIVKAIDRVRRAGFKDAYARR